MKIVIYILLILLNLANGWAIYDLIKIVEWKLAILLIVNAIVIAIVAASLEIWS